MTIVEEFADLLERTAVTATRVVAGAVPLFGHPKDSTSAAAQPTATLLFPAAPPGPLGSPGPPPAVPISGEAGGLQDGAERAGQDYAGSVTAAALTDQKVSELITQILASNNAARDRIQAILADIQSKATAIGPDLGDPAALMTYHQFIDQKFGEIEKLLADSRVDARSQAAIMAALGSEYETNAPVSDDGGSGGGQGAESTFAGESSDASDTGGAPGDGGSGDDGAVAGGGSARGGGDMAGVGGGMGVIDPLAGMGLGGLGGMEPMSMMAPAMAGLGALPGSFGGLGGLAGGAGGLGLEGLGPALGSLIPGLSDAFNDKPTADIGKNTQFTDTAADQKQVGDHAGNTAGAEPDQGAEGEHSTPPVFVDNQTGEPGGPAENKQPPRGPEAGVAAAGGAAGSDVLPAATSGPLPAEAGAPAAAAPAGAAGQAPTGDAGRTVTLPDGTPIVASSDERAAAMRAVMSGSSVTTAYDGGVPPPGTPVLSPVSRSQLQAGDYGQFATKAPIMYMGDNRIWMDGQLQPLGALRSGPDFLGWSPPPAGGVQHQASAATPPPARPAGN